MPDDKQHLTQDPAERRLSKSRVTGAAAPLALLAWGFLVLAFSAAIAGEAKLWWILPLLGAAAPLVLVLLARRTTSTREREVLSALRKRGELTPTSAAMLTSLTTSEAAGVLERMARGGHLEARADDGTLVYALREPDRKGLQASEVSEGSIDPPTEPLTEPLTERELEVLRLVASGRTNREISTELFVATGTVKAHVASIYRKLGAANRAEAVTRGSSLGLLP